MPLKSAAILLSLLAGVLAQDPSAASSAAPSSAAASGTPTSAAPAAGGSPSVSLSVDSNLPQTPLVTLSGFTLPPLSALTSGAATDVTVSLDTVYTQGTVPTAVSGAPPLPASTLTIANYPALDQVPPTDSPEVMEWLSKIDFSKVPTYNQTDGTCGGTPGAITDGRCWWTCGGCTRATDITVCPDKMTWGLSYDDGPSPFTPLLLDYLNEQKIKTTFFVVGSRVLSRPDMLQSEYGSGHQISVHTWSHPYLTKLTNEEIVAELGWTMKVIRDTIGVTPNTMRPPYGDIDDRVRAICAQMGLTPVLWTSVHVDATNMDTDFDTTDYKIAGNLATGPSALSMFEEILNVYVPKLDTGFIVLEHDLYQQTVDLAIGYVLPMAISSGKFKLMSIINCMGVPDSQAYIETSSNSTATVVSSAASTFFQASIGSGSAAPVTSTGSAASSSSTKASSSSGAAVRMTDAPSLKGIVPVVVSLVAVAMGMTLVA